MEKLKFSKGNAKLGKHVDIFNLPAGWSCPGALKCKSKAMLINGKYKVVDGPKTEFRCFAASQEALYKGANLSRSHNFEILKQLKTASAMARHIQASLPPRKGDRLIRVHASGDFFSQKYFDAWVIVAESNPNWTIYAYTKSLRYWVTRKHYLPSNLILTASYGGKYDHLIAQHKLKSAKVVFSEIEALSLDLPIDHDDSYAMTPNVNFALLLHGVQPKDSPAAKAKEELKKEGWNGYGKG